MSLSAILNKDSIYIDSTARSKAAALFKLSQLLSEKYPTLIAEELFDAFWKRENMGSTTIGHGIMIPHIRSEALMDFCSCLLKLDNPVDFGAIDKKPVDLIIGLVVPSHQINEHLQTLSKIIKHFSQEEFRIACRNAKNTTDLYALFTETNENNEKN